MQSKVFAVGATRVNIGLSAIIKVSPAAYCGSLSFKMISSGGTLEIVPLPIALTGSSASGWGMGYPVGGTEAVNVPGPAAFYLAATGATATIAVMLGHSAGITLAV